MPKTREQIKHDPVATEVWRDNRTSVMWFDPREIKPMGDHILVELDEATEKTTAIVVPDVARNKDIGTRIGTILAVGPGKWIERTGGMNFSWFQAKLVFKPTRLKPGDRVVIGHYSDWESWNCSADGHQASKNVALCQEADVRFVIKK